MTTNTDTTVEVSISLLRIEPGLQVRVDGIDPDHVATLAEAIDDLPPPRCVKHGKGYVPIDGHHTIAVHQNAGRTKLRVQLVEPPADGDLYAAAFETNVAHGKALTLRDKTAFARHLISCDPSVANMEVSRRTGLSASTVENVREHLEDDEGLERTDRTVVRGGVTYTYPATRRPGELPAKGFGEGLADVGTKLFSKPERVRQRKISSFLRRVVVAMEDGVDLVADPDEAAQAAVLVLGDEAPLLGGRLAAVAAPIAEAGRRLAEGA